MGEYALLTAKEARQHTRDWAADSIRIREIMDSDNCSEASWEHLKVAADASLSRAAQWAQIAIALEEYDQENNSNA